MMKTDFRILLSNPPINAGVQIERPHGGNIISLVLMSAFLLIPLPAMGQSSETSVVNRGDTSLAFNIKDIVPRLLRRTPRRPSQQPSRGDRTPISTPSSNSQPRQPQSSQSVSPQEQQYLDSLSPEERQVYEIIQKAKKDLGQQPTANMLGSIFFGLPAKQVTQTPQDLDREFQNAIRGSNSLASSQPTVNGGSIASETKPGNQILQRILNKRSNETHEQWYARIDPVIARTPGQEYRAWKATLSLADNKVYDILVKRENNKRMEETSEALSDTIKRDLEREASCRWVPDPNDAYAQSVKVCND